MISSADIFKAHQGNLIDKWDNYFEIYDRHFKDYVGKEVVLLEIGVSQGGSIDLWKKFFGDKLRYYGVDINPRCKEHESDNVKIFIGSQEDKVFLEQLKNELPEIDILIDDGGHTMRQQIVSFEILFSKIKDNGIYLCEDTHTSYWFRFGGGMKRRGNYINYVKNLVDVMHMWHVGKNTYIKNHQLKHSIYAIHFYDSIVVIDKRKMRAPKNMRSGNLTVGYVDDNSESLYYKVTKFMFHGWNRMRSMFYK